MDSIVKKIETASDLEFISDVLHDAVFSFEGILDCPERREFQLTCFRILDEIYERKIIMPFVYKEKHMRKKCILRFFNVEKIEKKINANIEWYSIVNITYKVPKIIVRTEGCIDLVVSSKYLSGFMEDCDEIIQNSLGYSDISFGVRLQQIQQGRRGRPAQLYGGRGQRGGRGQTPAIDKR